MIEEEARELAGRIRIASPQYIDIQEISSNAISTPLIQKETIALIIIASIHKFTLIRHHYS